MPKTKPKFRVGEVVRVSGWAGSRGRYAKILQFCPESESPNFWYDLSGSACAPEDRLHKLTKRERGE